MKKKKQKNVFPTTQLNQTYKQWRPKNEKHYNSACTSHITIGKYTSSNINTTKTKQLNYKDVIIRYYLTNICIII